MTLTEFLLARIADDERAQQEQLMAKAFPAGVPRSSAPAVEARLRGTMAWAGIGVTAMARRLSVAGANARPGSTSIWLKQQAAKYADHPDYDPAWSEPR